MCHNIVDGWYHTPCNHFVSVSSRLHDCLQTNCLFSRRHLHPYGCKSQDCIRMMSLPVHNPIRISPTRCMSCRQRHRPAETT
ncbi:hypothetical protein BU17DRAFT_78309 [Hysterangium stoloniferum]|nr:hypothetical protein BU17DRAFT_78309 [Hysterangium stoloniferum]